MFTVSTMQVDDGRIELLNPNEMILRNTGKKPTASERLAAGAVQSELNSIFNTQLDVDGWYGGQSAGTVRDLQKELSLPATGVLDVQTFYQLQLAVESGASYKRSVAPVSTGASIKPLAGNTGPNYALSNVPGDYNGNRIPDQYEPYAQGTSYKASSGAGTNYALSNVPGDYNGNGIPDQYDSYAQGTGNSTGEKSPYTYDISPDININGNRTYMFQGGVQGGNDYVGGSINAYAVTGMADAYALFGWESNYNATKTKGGKDKQIMGIDLRAQTEVAATTANANGFVGYKDYVGLIGEAEGSVGKAQAYGAFTARIDGEESIGFRLGAEAAVFDGSIGGGFYLFGYEIKVGLEGSAIAAGAKAELGVVDGRFRARAKAALGIGGGVWVDIGKK